jgi:hypothetical protein
MSVQDRLARSGCPSADAESLADSWLRVGDFLLYEVDAEASVRRAESVVSWPKSGLPGPVISLR